MFLEAQAISIHEHIIKGMNTLLSEQLWAAYCMPEADWAASLGGGLADYQMSQT